MKIALRLKAVESNYHFKKGATNRIYIQEVLRPMTYIGLIAKNKCVKVKGVRWGYKGCTSPNH